MFTLQVAVACSGLRCVAYLLCYYSKNGEQLPKKLLTPLVQVPPFLQLLLTSRDVMFDFIFVVVSGDEARE